MSSLWGGPLYMSHFSTSEAVRPGFLIAVSWSFIATVLLSTDFEIAGVEAASAAPLLGALVAMSY